MRWPEARAVRRQFPRLLLPAILLVALALRLYGLEWDQGNHYHPDERSIYMRVDCMYRVLTQAPNYAADCTRDQPFNKTQPGVPSLGTFFDADKSALNPHWFPLGSILIYALLIIKLALSPFAHMGLTDLALAGRTLAALADTASVAMAYLLGARLYGRKAGLLAAALLAVTVAAIQIAHFYRPESFTVLWVFCATWFMLNVIEKRRLRDSAFLGLFVGLAFSTKVSTVPLLLPVAIAYGARLLWLKGEGGRKPSPGLVGRVAGEAALAGAVALAVFLFWMPYAFIDLPQLLEDMARETRIIRVPGIVPYTVQYLGTPRFWYEIRQSSVWGLGLPLGVVAWGGLLFALWRFARSRWEGRWGDLLLLAWIAPNLLIVGSFEVKFLRYVFPILPFLVLLGARMLAQAVEWTRERWPRLRPWAIGAVAAVVAATALYALAFADIYSRPHTAVQASRWVNQNVPQGATILTDNHWDEGFPDLGRYRVKQIPIFEGDSRQKMENLARDLSRADYILFYSNRTYGSVARVPDRYPLSAAYYQALFKGELGYKLERQFTSYPELPGIAFADDTYTRAGLPPPVGVPQPKPAPLTLNLGYADENVVDYDHPKVLLFRNVERLPQPALSARLTAGADRVLTGRDTTGGQLLTDAEWEAQRQGGTWTEIVRPNAWASRVPVLAWLLLVELLCLSALPLAWHIFAFLPDRGILLAKLLGLLGASYVAWILASAKVLEFSRMSLLVGVLAMAALSAVVLAFRWREFLTFLRRHWRLALVGEVLFLAAFLSFLAVRAANPDLWHPFRGGEKPMEFAYLNAVFRSTYMPPYDPWFAGGAMNYYYWGYFVVAGLVKALGIDPAVGYNLAVPLLYALTALGAFAIVYNVTEGLRRARGSATRWARGPVAAGLVAALFVVAIGNLDGVVQLIQGRWSNFDFWRSSRMIPELANQTHSALRFWLPAGQNVARDISPHITEFPFFTFLFADLHAHMMTLPFTLLAIGLALALLLQLRSGARPLTLAPVAIALAVAVGALAPINTWDYPGYALLAVTAVGAGVLMRRGNVRERAGLFLAIGAGVVATSLLAWFPYHLRYEAPASGIETAKWATPIWSYMGQFGLFIFTLVSFLAIEWWRNRHALRGRWWLAGMALAIAIAVYLGVAGYWTAAVLAVLLAAVAGLVVRTLSQRDEATAYRLFPLLLAGLALAVSFGVEFVRLQGDIGRMNTQFKLYLEAWVLLALSSAFILWWMASERGLLSFNRGAVAKVVWLGALAALALASLVYPVLGTRARLSDRFNALPLTLDGTAYMRQATYNDEHGPIRLEWDRQAIQWLKENVQGSPVILEGFTTQYRWGARIADNTGLPSLLGWHWHQTQQRGRLSYLVDGRRALVDELYTRPDEARTLELLRQYHVEYVVVGELERLYYPASGLAKFDAMQSRGLELVYENPGTRIYRVMPPTGYY